MSFDVVLVFVNDQRRVLLEQSKLQGVGDADLFRRRFLAGATHSMEQICSRLRSLSALFPFFLIRHAREIFLLCLVAAFLGIPLSYFLLREKR